MEGADAESDEEERNDEIDCWGDPERLKIGCRDAVRTKTPPLMKRPTESRLLLRRKLRQVLRQRLRSRIRRSPPWIRSPVTERMRRRKRRKRSSLRR